MTVSATGPIIAFARIGRLDLFQATPDSLLIPQAVYDKLASQATRRPNVQELQDLRRAGWLQVRPLTQRTFLQGMSPVLHSWEREAMPPRRSCRRSF